jgi:hypothetical protein
MYHRRLFIAFCSGHSKHFSKSIKSLPVSSVDSHYIPTFIILVFRETTTVKEALLGTVVLRKLVVVAQTLTLEASTYLFLVDHKIFCTLCLAD